MEPKTPQLNAYDLLGYLVPGISLIFLVDLSVAYHLKHLALDYAQILKRYQGISWNAAIPILLLSYYVGHIVSFVSSFTLERYARWYYGRPSNILMEEPRDKIFADIGVGQFFMRLIVTAFMLPIGWIEFIFGWILGLRKAYIRPFDKLVKQIVAKAYADLLKRVPIKFAVEFDGKDFGRYDYAQLGLHYALESAPAHIYSLRNYVVLYGFLRAMTLILVLTTWIAVLHGLKSGMFIYAIIPFVVGGAISFISYAAFLKFLYRYHREAMMAVTSVYMKHGKPQCAPTDAVTEVPEGL